MDEFEKSVYKEFGTGIISSENVNKFLIKAAEKGLIERKDIKPQPSMKSSELIEHVKDMRRLFLVDESFKLEEDPYESLCCSGEKKDNTETLNKVLKAYFEFEKMNSYKKKKGKSGFVVFFLILTGVIVYFSYTPVPY